jgi:hypothetical protein
MNPASSADGSEVSTYPNVPFVLRLPGGGYELAHRGEIIRWNLAHFNRELWPLNGLSCPFYGVPPTRIGPSPSSEFRLRRLLSRPSVNRVHSFRRPGRGCRRAVERHDRPN